MSMRDDLVKRLAVMQARRADIARQRQQELDQLDARIQATAGLVAQWNTLTIDEALAALEAAGIRLQTQS